MIKTIIKYILSYFGYEIISSIKHFPIPEATSFEKNIINKGLKFSMTNEVRIWTLIQSIKYIYKNNIAGDFVECGVFKGGNLLVYKTLNDHFKLNKNIYGYDTFEGMTEPGKEDKTISGNFTANKLSSENNKFDNNGFNYWCYSSIDEVRKNLNITNIENSKIKLIKGRVEDTLLNKNSIPEKISILRLDTDFYISTKI